jgi:hypothetical protein
MHEMQQTTEYTMKIYLNVKFEERFKAKSLGALWDPIGKSWYVESRNTDISKFTRFMHAHDHLNDPHKETEYERQSRITREMSGKNKKARKCQ